VLPGKWLLTLCKNDMHVEGSNFESCHILLRSLILIPRMTAHIILFFVCLYQERSGTKFRVVW
jgi:hypothetical protein